MKYIQNRSDYIGQILRNPKWVAKVEAALLVGVDRRGPDDCWAWTGRRRGDYGAVVVHHRWEEATHRLAYALHHRQSPFPLSVCHTCDNPICCNPNHLFVGTALDNAADMMAKGRHTPSPQPGESNPRALLTEVQVAEIRDRIARTLDTNTLIAADYGVSHSTISLIRRGKSWGGSSELKRHYVANTPRPGQA